MKKLTYLLTGLLLIGTMASCDEDSFLSENNPNELSSGTFYRNGPQLQAAVNAVYANLQTQGLFVRRYFFVNDLLSGEVVGLGGLGAEMRQLSERTYLPSNDAIGQYWTSLYRGIHRANLVIANAPNVQEQITEQQRNRMIAEARFLRAWHYWELVSNWGSVPLLTEPADQEDINGVPRAPVDQIWALIQEDLDFAEQNLPRRSEWPTSETGRVTKGAAMALKGKIALFRGQYPQAATEFQKVVSLGEYSLVPEYFDNFREETENNAESIFEVQFAVIGGGSSWAQDEPGTFEGTFRAQEYGFREWRNVVPSTKLLAEYEQNDPRYKANFYSACDLFNNDRDTVYTPVGCPPPPGRSLVMRDELPSWRKYQNHYKRSGELNANSGINFRVIRYADVLLGLAEARAEGGDLAGAVALVNQVRARSKMPAISVGSKDQVISAIYHERIVEFAGEQVLYKDFLRRPSYLREWAPRVELPKHLLLPIPQGEIDNNNALTNADQNPGY